MAGGRSAPWRGRVRIGTHYDATWARCYVLPNTAALMYLVESSTCPPAYIPRSSFPHYHSLRSTTVRSIRWRRTVTTYARAAPACAHVDAPARDGFA